MRIKEKGAVLSSGSLVDYGFDYFSFLWEEQPPQEAQFPLHPPFFLSLFIDMTIAATIAITTIRTMNVPRFILLPSLPS